jgi:Protein of unknown function (DUF2510)
MNLAAGVGAIVLAVLPVCLVAFGIVVLVRKLAKPKSSSPQGISNASTVASPGWYPDPNESSLMRYFDGHAWTAETQPRG